MKMNCNPQLISDNGVFKFIDNTDEVLKSRKIARLFERYRTYFSDFEGLELSRELNYIELTELINKITSRIGVELEVDSEIQAFIFPKLLCN